MRRPMGNERSEKVSEEAEGKIEAMARPFCEDSLHMGLERLNRRFCDRAPN
jgi:hypothetical protein